MTILVVLLATLAVLAIVATVRDIRSDGYRRTPTRESTWSEQFEGEVRR